MTAIVSHALNHQFVVIDPDRLERVQNMENKGWENISPTNPALPLPTEDPLAAEDEKTQRRIKTMSKKHQGDTDSCRKLQSLLDRHGLPQPEYQCQTEKGGSDPEHQAIVCSVAVVPSRNQIESYLGSPCLGAKAAKTDAARVALAALRPTLDPKVVGETGASQGWYLKQLLQEARDFKALVDNDTLFHSGGTSLGGTSSGGAEEGSRKESRDSNHILDRQDLDPEPGAARPLAKSDAMKVAGRGNGVLGVQNLEKRYPATLSSTHRRAIHEYAEELGLSSCSRGRKGQRYLTLRSKLSTWEDIQDTATLRISEEYEAGQAKKSPSIAQEVTPRKLKQADTGKRGKGRGRTGKGATGRGKGGNGRGGKDRGGAGTGKGGKGRGRRGNSGTGRGSEGGVRDLDCETR